MLPRARRPDLPRHRPAGVEDDAVGGVEAAVAAAADGRRVLGEVGDARGVGEGRERCAVAAAAEDADARRVERGGREAEGGDGVAVEAVDAVGGDGHPVPRPIGECAAGDGEVRVGGDVAIRARVQPGIAEDACGRGDDGRGSAVAHVDQHAAVARQAAGGGVVGDEARRDGHLRLSAREARRAEDHERRGQNLRHRPGRHRGIIPIRRNDRHRRRGERREREGVGGEERLTPGHAHRAGIDPVDAGGLEGRRKGRRIPCRHFEPHAARILRHDAHDGQRCHRGRGRRAERHGLGRGDSLGVRRRRGEGHGGKDAGSPEPGRRDKSKTHVQTQDVPERLRRPEAASSVAFKRYARDLLETYVAQTKDVGGLRQCPSV